MSIPADIQTKLESNQRTIFITDADDLLAAWQFRRRSSPKRSINLGMVPTQWRYSAPPSDTSPLMPCHIFYRRKAGISFSDVLPAEEYGRESSSTDHGRNTIFSVPDLSALRAANFKKRNVAPYVSPILDGHTVELIRLDLGLSGKVVSKVVEGRQYIAFVEKTGSRVTFPGTDYSLKHRKTITMAIGSLGIENMANKGARITICLAVGLAALEAFLSDHHCVRAFYGNLSSDIIKIGLASLMGIISGAVFGAATTIAAFPVALTMAVSVRTGIGLNPSDTHHHLINQLTAALEDMNARLSPAVKDKVDGSKRATQTRLCHFPAIRLPSLNALP